MGDLGGKLALVTGGNRGLGLAIARLLTDRGARVAITHRDPRGAERARELAASLGGLALCCDVARRDQVEQALDSLVAAWGGLDILINNAGVMQPGTLAQPDWRAAQAQIEVNLLGPMHCMHAAWPHLAQRRGAVVNLASVAGLGPSVLSDAYAATKHGLVGLTRTWALELAPTGVRINAVAPGPVPTDMLADSDAETMERMRAMAPMGRLVTAEEVAQAVVFLASDLASGITGQTLVVDGGRLMH